MFAVRFVACSALLAGACGAGDNRLDPGTLELRDVLGISPDVALTWEPDQRTAARQVIEDGLHQLDAVPVRASLAKDGIPKTLAVVDADRAKRHVHALGVVDLEIHGGDVLATPKLATLEPRAATPVELRLAGWDGALAPLPARGMATLAEIASDAGHRSGPLVVSPAPQLAVVAGYVPASASEPARLVVNPVVLAVLEPAATVERPASTGNAAAPPPGAITTSAAVGNPYSFYGSVAECAVAQERRCTSCLVDGSCSAITDLGDGNAECTQLGANGGRGYYLICINLALAIDSVSSCTASSAPTCPRDTHASDSITTIENNARFLDDPACGMPLDGCLAAIYGSPNGSFPPPGSDAGTSPPPRNTSVDCTDSCSGDSNCEVDPSCELDGPSCDSSGDGACADSNDQSGCSDSGGGGGDSSCSGDGEDSCGSSDNSGCDSSDCGGGGDSDCGGGGGGDCGGDGGGDCGGGGGDCGGGGGDCGGGGGGDCNAGKRARGAGAGLPVAIAWAFLPIPFAARVRRRAERRRAREAAAREGVSS